MSATNIIDMLTEDHEKVNQLLSELNETTSRATKKRTELLEQIEKEVLMHTRIEEEIFYPAFKEAGAGEGDKMYFEAKEEHRAVKDLVLPDLKKTAPDTPEFSGRAKVLKELIEHHAEEEEEEMFPKAKELMTEEQLKQLGEKAMKMKKGG